MKECEKQVKGDASKQIDHRSIRSVGSLGERTKKREGEEEVGEGGQEKEAMVRYGEAESRTEERGWNCFGAGGMGVPSPKRRKTTGTEGSAYPQRSTSTRDCLS